MYEKVAMPAHLRDAVLARDGYRCRYCGSGANLTVDHVHPEVLGGPAGMENLQCLCNTCNSRKGGRVVPPGATAPAPLAPLSARPFRVRLRKKTTGRVATDLRFATQAEAEGRKAALEARYSELFEYWIEG